MSRREPRDRLTARTTATWLAAGAAVIGAATLFVRRNHPGRIRALTDAGYDVASGRGRPGTPASPVARDSGHETLDMRGGLMAKLILLLGSVAVCMVLAMIGLRIWVSTIQRDSQPPLTREQTAIITPPEPHLQRDPLGDIARLLQSEEKLLGGTAYLDESRTRARIPIDRAMALTVGQPLAPPL